MKNPREIGRAHRKALRSEVRQPIDEKLRQGEALFGKGCTKEAEELFLGLLKETPHNAELLNNLGVLCHALGRSQEAEAYMKRALAVEPDHEDALINLRSLYQEAGRWEKAGAIRRHKGGSFDLPLSVGEDRLKVLLCCLPNLDNFVDDLIRALKPGVEITKLVSNRIDDFLAALTNYGVVWLEWGNQLAEALTKHGSGILKKKRVICRIHSYEVLDGLADVLDFSVIDDLIFVSSHIRDIFLHRRPEIKKQVARIHVIPNCVDLDRFKFSTRPRGFNLAYLGSINHKKGPMLLLHAFWQLFQADKRYHLHIGGNYQDLRYQLYFNQMVQAMDLTANVHFDGWVSDVPAWLENKHFIGCTSVLEGHPVGITEAMAMGLKPLIHNYVGAQCVFPKEYVWSTIPEFVQQVTTGEYQPAEYREFIERNYPLERQTAAIRSILTAVEGEGVIQTLDTLKEEHRLHKSKASVPLPESAQTGVSGLEIALPPDVEQSLDWLNRNIVGGSAIIVSSRKRQPYPEVTGYFIPTLIAAGRRDLALQFAAWLPTVQNADGSFPAPGGGPGFAFATGQIVRGLVAALDEMPELEQPLRRACNWLLNSSVNGRLPLPPNLNSGTMGCRGDIFEGVHLYALPGLLQAAEKLGQKRYFEFVRQSLDYYLNNVELTDFRRPNMLTHLFVYIQEALFDLGAEDVCRKGMKQLAEFQWPNGGVPAYSDVDWVCTPGLAQSAVSWFKIGEPDRARQALSFLKMIRNPSGGFFGSYGVGADYFATEEISWSVKFYLDALLLAARPIAKTKNEATRDVRTNMDAQSWHSAIVGGNNPDSIANRLRQGQIQPWAETIIAQTKAWDKVLELGSGTGEMSAALALAGRRVTMLDFSSASLHFSRRLFELLDLGADYRQTDVLQRLPFPDGAFDCVFSSGLLEHFDPGDQVRIIAEAARVSSGLVISFVPNAASLAYRLGKWAQERAGLWKWGKEDPIFSLADLYRKAGLTDIQEFSIEPLHALNFLKTPDTALLAQALRGWFASLPPDELPAFNQGYLLACIGKVPENGKSKHRLAVVPSDPLSAYLAKGYLDLTGYFNPHACFDEVYCLSPQEDRMQEIYGMKVIPTRPEDFARRVKELGIDVIRAYDLRAGSFASAYKPPDTPLIVSVHDINPTRVPPKIPLADKYLAISEAVAKFLSDRGAQAERIVRFANRVNTDVFRPIDDPNQREAFRRRYPGRFLLLHVGRRVEQKNLDNTIKALAELGPDYTLIQVGQGDAAPFRRMAENLGLAKRIYFIDSVPNDELPPYYSFCDCMCVPSRWEEFGIVFIEALACAAVVVTSNLAPMNEYIRHEANGLLVDEFESPPALAATIQKACTDSEMSRILKYSARNSITAFSVDRITDAEEAIYREILAGAPKSLDVFKPGPIAKEEFSMFGFRLETKDACNKLVALPDARTYDGPEEQACVRKYGRPLERTLKNVPKQKAPTPPIQETAIPVKINEPAHAKVSVVLPTYNQAAMLPEAVESVINQTFRDFEFVIVNDGSTDNTREYLDTLRDPRIKVIHQENKRLPGALNVGFSNACGRYLTWTSSDNICAPYFLEALVGALDAFPQAGLAYADFFFIDDRDRILNRVSNPWYSYRSLISRNDGNAAFLYRRNCQERIGLYDTELEGAEDWDYWLRIAEQFPLVYVSEALYYYRLHDQSMQSTKRDKINHSAAKTLEKAWARRGGRISLEDFYPSLKTCSDQRSARFAAAFDLGTRMLGARVPMRDLSEMLLEEAARLFPDSLPARLNLSFALVLGQKWNEALKRLPELNEANGFKGLILKVREAIVNQSKEALLGVQLPCVTPQSHELMNLESRSRMVFSFTQKIGVPV